MSTDLKTHISSLSSPVKKIHFLSVELDLIHRVSFWLLFWVFYKKPSINQALSKPGVPTSSLAAGCPHLPSASSSRWISQHRVSRVKHTPMCVSSQSVCVRTGTSRARALKRSLIHPTFFSSPCVCGDHPPVPGPFLPSLAALWLSSSLSLSLMSE